MLPADRGGLVHDNIGSLLITLTAHKIQHII